MGIPATARRLLDFIGSKEAPLGYDTVFGNKMHLMPKPLTTMTVDEVIAQGEWRNKAFGSSAAGRYQFMRATLLSLKQTERLTGSERMTPALQDRLGYALLLRRGFSRFVSGALSVVGFGLGLAQEWASFPVLAATKGAHRQVQRGQTYYLGDGVNKVLATAGEVESVLRAILGAPAAAAAPPAPIVPTPVIAAPHVETVTPDAPKLPWWARLLGVKPPVAVARPGLAPNGDPALWDVQKALKDRAYYVRGKLDGLDGGFTQGAVAQSRKDIGLGDGGIDAEFLAALPTMPSRPVSTARANAGIRQAAAAAPEVFNPLKWVGTLGLGSLGIGTADLTGLIDKVSTGATKVSQVADGVQGGLTTIGGLVAFAVDHKGLIAVAGGLYLVVWAAGKAMDGVIKFRAAFL